MPIPIPDLRVDENGIFGTLSFSRTPFACNVPWNAIFALVGDEGRGMVWPESMPAEIVAEVERETQRAKLGKDLGDSRRPREEDGVLPWPARSEDPSRRSKEPVVAVLRSTTPSSRPRRDSSRPPAPRPKRPRELPPYLRVVK
jgi:hypothetical protein